MMLSNVIVEATIPRCSFVFGQSRVSTLLSNASPTAESENNRPAARGAVGELRTEASNLITMRDLIGQRTISGKFT